MSSLKLVLCPKYQIDDLRHGGRAVPLTSSGESFVEMGEVVVERSPEGVEEAAATWAKRPPRSRRFGEDDALGTLAKSLEVKFKLQGGTEVGDVLADGTGGEEELEG